MSRSTVVVTGANRGIGLALCRQLLARGDIHLVAACRRPEAAAELRRLGDDHGDRLEIVALDVTDGASVAALAETLAGRSVDVLVNNAGIKGPFETLDDLDFEEWLQEFAVNTLAPVRVARALRASLRAAAVPRIVTITSQMGSLARQAPGHYAYRTSKAAANKAMQLLALDLEDDGIAVVAMHPGWVRTDMGGARGEISVEESAAGIIRVIDALTLADSGRFLTWQGRDHPW